MAFNVAIELTAVFHPTAEGGYVAFVEELPGANTQGETLDEARANLREAVMLVLESNRALSEESQTGVGRAATGSRPDWRGDSSTRHGRVRNDMLLC